MAGDGQVSFSPDGDQEQLRARCDASAAAPSWRASRQHGRDAFTLLERLEAKLERHPGQLTRACVELAKDWRTDRYLRRLEATMVGYADVSLVLTGNGDVLEPEDGLIGTGSGGSYVLAAKALADVDGALSRTSRGRPYASRPGSASTPTTKSSSRPWTRDDRADPEGDRLRARPLHRRPGRRRSARSRSRCATAGDASSSTSRCARRSRQEHPDDWPHRLRQAPRSSCSRASRRRRS